MKFRLILSALLGVFLLPTAAYSMQADFWDAAFAEMDRAEARSAELRYQPKKDSEKLTQAKLKYINADSGHEIARHRYRQEATKIYRRFGEGSDRDEFQALLKQRAQATAPLASKIADLEIETFLQRLENERRLPPVQKDVLQRISQTVIEKLEAFKASEDELNAVKEGEKIQGIVLPVSEPEATPNSQPVDEDDLGEEETLNLPAKKSLWQRRPKLCAALATAAFAATAGGIGALYLYFKKPATEPTPEYVPQ